MKERKEKGKREDGGDIGKKEKMSKEMECKPKNMKKYTPKKGWEEEDRGRETV